MNCLMILHQNKKVNLNISGGGDVAQYYLSVSHANENGLLKVRPLEVTLIIILKLSAPT